MENNKLYSDLVTAILSRKSRLIAAMAPKTMKNKGFSSAKNFFLGRENHVLRVFVALYSS